MVQYNKIGEPDSCRLTLLIRFEYPEVEITPEFINGVEDAVQSQGRNMDWERVGVDDTSFENTTMVKYSTSGSLSITDVQTIRQEIHKNTGELPYNFSIQAEGGR